MKIKITKDYQNLKAGTVINNMCEITGGTLVSKGVAVVMDGPKLAASAPAAAKEKPLSKCNLDDLKEIVEKEKVDIGTATTKKDIVAAIELHRKNIKEAAEAEAANAEIVEYLSGREDCDDTCRYAAPDDHCELPEGFACPKSEAETE